MPSEGDVLNRSVSSMSGLALWSGDVIVKHLGDPVTVRTGLKRIVNVQLTWSNAPGGTPTDAVLYVSSISGGDVAICPGVEVGIGATAHMIALGH